MACGACNKHTEKLFALTVVAIESKTETKHTKKSAEKKMVNCRLFVYGLWKCALAQLSWREREEEEKIEIRLTNFFIDLYMLAVFGLVIHTTVSKTQRNNVFIWCNNIAAAINWVIDVCFWLLKGQSQCDAITDLIDISQAILSSKRWRKWMSFHNICTAMICIYSCTICTFFGAAINGHMLKC